MTKVCGRLVHLDTPCLDANARPYFQDVLDHVRRVDAMVNSLRDVLTSVFEVSNLLEQQRPGVITRQPLGPRYWPYPPRSLGSTA